MLAHRGVQSEGGGSGPLSIPVAFLGEMGVEAHGVNFSAIVDAHVQVRRRVHPFVLA
jgi:hypothetical protein